jgi:hypothetical protein
MVRDLVYFTMAAAASNITASEKVGVDMNSRPTPDPLLVKNNQIS